jgi:uncharacterized protein YndB with AHSA1/START domain
MSDTNNSVNGSIKINAPLSKIWDTLINPEKIVLYTGSTTRTDWKKGSPVTWSGEMNGAKYQNKGIVLENTPNRLLRFTYWSGMGGDADLPENYSEITYALNPIDDNIVELTYSRIKIPTVLEKQIFDGHIQSMLEEIKRLSEE